MLENTFYNVSRMVDKVIMAACDTTLRNPVRAVIGPWGVLCRQMFSWLGFLKPLILRIYWPSDERIKSVTAPILFISGTTSLRWACAVCGAWCVTSAACCVTGTVDQIVPPAHMKDLYHLAERARGA